MSEHGKTQKELADIVGVSAPTVNDWVHAKIYPRIEKIEILAKVFGIQKSDLIEYKPTTPATKMYSNIEIGNIIRQKRIEAGLTQAELGLKLGVGKTAVAKWEAGKVKNLKRESLQHLEHILGVSPLILLGFKRAKKRQIVIDEDDFTPEQFAQIKHFVSFIKSQNRLTR